MANHKSALKRAKQNLVRRMRNRAVKTQIKTATKTIVAADAENAEVSAETTAAALIKAQSLIDKAAKKGVLHKRTAARKISRLTKKVNALNA